MGTEIDNNNIQFAEIIKIIETAKERAYKAVNAELINMYWDIGEYISNKVKNEAWGNSVVSDYADFIHYNYPDIKGFSAQNIWRMKQFYETYKDKKKLSPLVREISWTNNLSIMSGAKTDEAKEFYLILAAKNHYSKRELERQIDSMLFERTMLSQSKNKDLITKNPSLGSFRDNYVLEFLNIPDEYHEKDLRKSILLNLKKFILEFGSSFTFVGEEYRIQVGNSDFFIDLLFFNRDLSCLVAIELKVGKFKPEHMGQLNFYLEALDRDVKKDYENPSVGLILCTSKDDTVVEYALSRSLSQTMVSEYTLRLPDKKLLRNKLKELTELAEDND